MTLSNKQFSIVCWFAVMVGVLGCVPGLLPFRVNKLITLEIALISLVALFFVNNIWIRLFVLWSAVRVLFGVNSGSTLSLHALFIVVMAYQVIANNVNKDRETIILNIVCWLAIAQSLMMVLQCFGVWIVFVPKGYENFGYISLFERSNFPLRLLFRPELFRYNVTGFLDNVNITAALFAMCLPAFFRRGWVLALPIVFVGLWLSHSLGGMIAATLATITWLLFRYRLKTLYALPIVVGLLFIYFLKFETLNGILTADRFAAWKYIITDIIPVHWITGFGLGQGVTLWPQIALGVQDNQIWLHSHNEFITLWLELGVVGFILCIIYLSTTLWTLTKQRRLTILSGMIAALVCANTVFIAHSVVGLIMVLYMAMAEGGVNERKV